MVSTNGCGTSDCKNWIQMENMKRKIIGRHLF